MKKLWRIAMVVVLAPAAILSGCGRFAASSAETTARWTLTGPDPRNLVVIMIDTLRADHLPCYGYSKDTAPFLCGLAQRSVVFERAISASSYTAPATASVFVGSYPSRHGVITGFRDHGRLADKDASITLNRIPEHFTTMAEMLRGEGFTTFAVADNLNICRDMGFDQGFDHFSTFLYEGAERVNLQVERWRQKLDTAHPFFLYLHYMDPHKPYNRRQPWFETGRDPGQTTLNAYDSEIRYLDQHLAGLFERFGWLEDSIVVVLSDHGEEFGEHNGSGHGRTLYREVIHVPFFIYHPELGTGIRVEETVSTVGLLPTLAELLGVPPVADWESASLLPVMTGHQHVAQPVFSELLRHPEDWRAQVRSVIRSGHHLIRTRLRGSFVEVEEIYDLGADFGEQADLSESVPELKASLGTILTAFEQRPQDLGKESVEVDLDPETLEQLRRLGYVD